MSLEAVAPRPALFLLGRVWMPFALGVYLSYLVRTVNAVIAPHLAANLALSAADLGLVSSAYLAAFTAAQLPVGLLLDRYGPRRVQVGFLLAAAAGALLFAAAHDWGAVMAGRLLLGIGLGASLMALIKASVDWFPAGQLARLNGANFAVGGFGTVTATLPVAAFADAFGWRASFLVLALGIVAVAALLLAVTPERERPAGAPGMAAQWRDLCAVLASAPFRRMAPLSAVLHGGIYMAVQGLWAGPWLHDVAGFDSAGAALCLLLLAAAVMAGHLGQGVIAGELQRRGKGLVPFVVLTGCGLVAALLGLAWGGRAALPLGLIFGLLAATLSVNYVLLSQSYPAHLAGRVNTALNLVVFGGAFLGQWGIGGVLALWAPLPGGGVPVEAYRAAAAGLAALAVPAILWFGLAGRLGPRWRLGAR